jgi:transcriptional regulator with GAF, ATPase, and Fis domain
MTRHLQCTSYGHCYNRANSGVSVPLLVCTEGVLKGRVFPVTASEFSIGRASSNDLEIGQLDVSRQHCTLVSESGTDGVCFRIRDCGSANNTFVNGLAVCGDRVLDDRDELAIGDNRFVFIYDERPDAYISASENTTGCSTVRLESSEVDVLAKQPAVDGEAQRRLDVLLTVISEASAVTSLREMVDAFFSKIAKVIPADRGAVIFAGPGLDKIENIVAWDGSRGAEGQPLVLSRTVIRPVLSQREAVVWEDLQDSPQFRGVKSVVSSRARAVLATPLIVRDKTTGAVYLETSDPAARFTRDHLRFVSAAASTIAPLLALAYREEQLESENRSLRLEIRLKHEMVGRSASIEDVYRIIARVAATDSTVLVQGESGTGKELAARAIHTNSRRAAKPFVAMNCAAIHENLMESELFGHERGAFTGAVTQKKGKLELADGGTLFLDEIGDMQLALQAKILRVLETREFERLGGSRAIRVNVRIVAATNRNLMQFIKDSRFREDLYYRLNVVSLTLPPLRERGEDIPMLADHFMRKFAEECKRPLRGISQEAMRHLTAYAWPGNVRELRNAIERAVVLGEAPEILPEDLPETVLNSGPRQQDSPSAYIERVREAKRQIVAGALRETKGNYIQAAARLGIFPSNFHRLLRELNLRTLPADEIK